MAWVEINIGSIVGLVVISRFSERYDIDTIWTKIDTFRYDIITLICTCTLLVFLHNLIVGSYGYTVEISRPHTQD